MRPGGRGVPEGGLGPEVVEVFYESSDTLVRTSRFNFPKGAVLRDCYETKSEVVVLGDPGPDHDCSICDCARSGSHILYVIKKGEGICR